MDPTLKPSTQNPPLTSITPEQISFSSICNLLDRLSLPGSTTHTKLQDIRQFLRKLRLYTRKQHQISHSDQQDDESIPPVRWLDPATTCEIVKILAPVSNPKPDYPLKQPSLAKIYIKALNLPPNSDAELAIRKWNVPMGSASHTDVERAGDLPGILQQHLQYRCADQSKLSLAQVVRFLNTLLYCSNEPATGSVKTDVKALARESASDTIDIDGDPPNDDDDGQQQTKVLDHNQTGYHYGLYRFANKKKLHEQSELFQTEIIPYATETENAWICRIILRDLHIGLSYKTILGFLHQGAPLLYETGKNLEEIVTKCFDESFDAQYELLKLANSNAHFVSLHRPVSCQLANRLASFEDIVRKMKDNNPNAWFYVEPKYDGERLLLHKIDDNFKCYSRNKNDTTDLYGRHLDDAVHSAIGPRNCILDGELVLWNSTLSICEPINKMRPFATGELSQDSSNSRRLLRYMIFDILYLEEKEASELKNNQVLNFPLWKRRQVLENIITLPKDQPLFALALVPMKKASTIDDMKRAMEYFLEAQYEGIIVKNPEKPYRLGERNATVAVKLKPDYLKSGILGDNDVLIVACSYGSGQKRSRSGKPSHFLLAVIDEKVSESAKSQSHTSSYWSRFKFLTVGRVGTGYSYEELENIQDRLHNHWIPYDRNNPPPHLQGLTGDDIPEAWIPPDKSIIVQIKASELVPSDKYTSGYCFRFPRVEKFRLEKEWFACMTLDDLIHAYQNDKRRFSMSGNDFAPSKRQKVSSKRKTVSLLQSQRSREFSSDKPQIFAGLKFNVDGNAKTAEKKEKIEDIIGEHGGTTNPLMTTDCDYMIAFSKNEIRVKAWISTLSKGSNSFHSGGDILHAQWIEECAEAGKIVDILPRHVIWGTEKLMKDIGEYSDPYGDYWYEFASQDSLKASLDSIVLESQESSLPEILMSDPELENLWKSYPGGMFGDYHVVVPFGEIEVLLLATIYLLEYHGATVSLQKSNDPLDSKTTHVLVYHKSDRTDMDAFAGIEVIDDLWVKKKCNLSGEHK